MTLWVLKHIYSKTTMILYANQKPNFTYTDMYKIYSTIFEIINDFLCLLKKKHQDYHEIVCQTKQNDSTVRVHLCNYIARGQLSKGNRVELRTYEPWQSRLLMIQLGTMLHKLFCKTIHHTFTMRPRLRQWIINWTVSTCIYQLQLSLTSNHKDLHTCILFGS